MLQKAEVGSERFAITVETIEFVFDVNWGGEGRSAVVLPREALGVLGFERGFGGRAVYSSEDLHIADHHGADFLASNLN